MFVIYIYLLKGNEIGFGDGAKKKKKNKINETLVVSGLICTVLFFAVLGQHLCATLLHDLFQGLDNCARLFLFYLLLFTTTCKGEEEKKNDTENITIHILVVDDIHLQSKL